MKVKEYDWVINHFNVDELVLSYRSLTISLDMFMLI